MNANFEPGILSPLTQYLQEGSQQPSMATPRPGTPRGSHFSRLSPESLGNPGTPGAHDHQKFPNSPWSGSEPATPGYNRNVVPSSPYISSYPNTPATPGSTFYQKPANGACINGGTTAVPPGSPWTDRSVCTPGPMTPMTPATPMHPNSSEHPAYSNGGSPTFLEHNGNNNKQQQQPHYTGLSNMVQDHEQLLPVPVMNHNNHVEQPLPRPPSIPQQGGNNPGGGGVQHVVAAMPLLPGISDSETSQAVDNNPNLISEFEDFLAKYITNRKNEDNGASQQLRQQQQLAQPHPQQPHLQQQQQQPGPPHQQQPYNAVNGMNGGIVYNNMGGKGPQMPVNNPHHNHNMMTSSQGPSSIGPMRGGNGKFHGQAHPYAYQNGMMRNRQVSIHNGMQPNNQYTGPPPQGPGVPPPQHPHQNNINMMTHPQQPQPPFGMHGGGSHPSAFQSSHAPPPPSNAGGYQQVGQPQPGNPGPYQNVQQRSQPNNNNTAVHWQPSQSVNNHHNMGMVNPNGQMMVNGNPSLGNNRGIPQQQGFQQYPVNTQNGMNNNNMNGMHNMDGGGGEQGQGVNVNGSNNMPPSYQFDPNQGMGNQGGGGGGVGNNGGMQMNAGTNSAMQLQAPSPLGMGLQPHQQQNGVSVPVQSPDELSLDLDGPYDGSNLSQNIWSKAYDKVSRTNPVAEVGKVLFDDIFTDNEVIFCTLSGRGSTQKFNPNKVLYLKKAVAWLMSKPQQLTDFNVATCEATLSQEDESGVRGLEKKVFTEYRSRRRGDILKGRNQPISS